MIAIAVAVLSAAAPAENASKERWLSAVRDRYPVVSPDGSKLLFESDRSGRTALYVAASDGSGVRLLIDTPGEPSNGSWSPDGKQIVYHEVVDGEFDIFIVNTDGSGRTNITNSPFEEAHAHWSPDGSVIYFNSDRATADRAVPWSSRDHDLYRLELATRRITRLTDCRAVCTNPNPSPDGKRIAFRLGVREPALSWTGRPSTMNSEVAVLDLATGTITNVTRHPAYDTWPSWAPDGLHVVYGSNRDPAGGRGQLFLTNVDTGSTRQLTIGSGSYGEPFFSPDGVRLFFSRSVADGNGSFISSMDLPVE